MRRCNQKEIERDYLLRHPEQSWHIHRANGVLSAHERSAKRTARRRAGR